MNLALAPRQRRNLLLIPPQLAALPFVAQLPRVVLAALELLMDVAGSAIFGLNVLTFLCRSKPITMKTDWNSLVDQLLFPTSFLPFFLWLQYDRDKIIRNMEQLPK
ncbi:hypothetical protein PC116_g33293 [Phytophthora cactorum]|nr:hypothetical protein PC116_g33293 [Phytophthora cactorum]